MMKSVAVCAWLTVVLMGCSPASSTSAAKFAFYSIQGYQVDVEVKDDGSHSEKSKRTNDGNGQEIEEMEMRTGDVIMTISNGKLTLNGDPRGTVKSGDRIKVMLSGKIYVNDAERGKE
jgi:hypothetical protein